jgi:hypothetical protein
MVCVPFKPHLAFSLAIRRISSRTARSIGGRPGLRRFDAFLLRRLRRHLLSVSGATEKADHRSRGRNWLAAATKARSAVL